MERAERGTTPPTSVGGEKDWQLGDDWKTSGGSAALVAVSLGLRRRKAAGGRVSDSDRWSERGKRRSSWCGPSPRAPKPRSAGETQERTDDLGLAGVS